MTQRPDSKPAFEYLESEYPKAVAFYDKRAKSSKFWFRVLSVYLIVMSALLTILTGIPNVEGSYRIFIQLLSASIGISAALLAHFKFHENWLSYRASWDALERERRFFVAKVERYANSKNAEQVFVARIETIRAKEGDDFYARHKKTDEQTNDPIETVAKEVSPKKR